MFSIVAAIAALAMCVSCKSNVASIDNKTFTLTELNGSTLEKVMETTPSISFDGSRVSATVGCNSITGEYKAGDDGALTFTYGASTRMFCPEEMREDEFLAAFNKVARYTVATDGEVSFLDAEGNLLFKAK